MGFNKKIACGLLLTAAFCGAGVMTCVGETHARYVNRATWYTVAEPTAVTVTGDSLTAVTDPPLTNLLGELTGESREVPITLTGGQNLSGALTWAVDQPQYINVGMRIGARELASGDLIGLSKNKPTTLIMTVEPTEQGLASAEALTVEIRVTWRETLTATYRVILSGAEDTTETEVIPQSPVQLKTVESFHPDTPIPFILTGEAATQAQLRMASDMPFPEGTRYSLDSGGSWYRLCREEKIQVDLPANKPVPVLLDISQTALAQEPTVTVITDDSAVTLMADPTPVFECSSRILSANTPMEISITEAWQDCRLDYRVEMLAAGDAQTDAVPVELSEESLSLTQYREETGSGLILRTGKLLPQPGTYRLYLQWSFDGLCFRQSEITFFINYTEQTVSRQTGGA